MKIVAWAVIFVLVATVVARDQAQAVPAGEACGPFVGAACDKGLWCEPPTGMCAAMSGVCVAVPRICVARKRSKSFRPVCGCNSKTYSSDCFRRAYKIAKHRDGKC